MKITLRQIQVFVSIAKLENMTIASEALALSQSACSMALSNLEAQLNTALFDRHGKKLILNDQGRALLTKAEHILSQVNELEMSVMHSSKEDIRGNLVLGASSTIGNYLLPTLIGDFITKNKNTKISLSVSNTEKIIDDILNFKIDMGLIEGHCYHPDIEVIPWQRDELIIIAPSKHKLAHKKNISLKEIKNENWIFRETGSGTREVTDKLLEGNIKPFLELGNTEAIKQAVISGLGISCVSKLTVLNALMTKQLVQLDIKNINLVRMLAFVIHREKYQTQALKCFMNLLIKHSHPATQT